MRKQLPWWLEKGAAVCPFCEDRLHVEALAYCSDCDRPICPACLVAEGHRALCPECHSDMGDFR